MAFFIGLLLLLFTSTQLSYADDDSGRIINGTLVEEGTWPFVVSLVYEVSYHKYAHFCGGSIIADDTILTATHCAFADAGQKVNVSLLQVYVGHVNRRSINKKYLYQAKTIIFNKDFLRPKIDPDSTTEKQQFWFRRGGDVCIIKLKRNITFEDGKVNKVCLPHPEAKPIGDKCVVMGWGATNPKNLTAHDDLRQAVVPLIDPKKCASVNENYNVKNLYCAGNLKKYRDSCAGDSGGPLVCPHEGDSTEYLQFGIVSFGNSCGKEGGFYQKTAPLIDWIKNKAGIN